MFLHKSNGHYCKIQLNIFRTRTPDWNAVEAMKENKSSFSITSSLSKKLVCTSGSHVMSYSMLFAKLTKEFLVPVNPNAKIRVCLCSSFCWPTRDNRNWLCSKIRSVFLVFRELYSDTTCKLERHQVMNNNLLATWTKNKALMRAGEWSQTFWTANVINNLPVCRMYILLLWVFFWIKIGKRFGPWQQVGHLQLWKSKRGRRNSVEDAFTAVDYLATYRTLQEQVSIKMSTATASKVALPARKAIFSVSTYWF